MKVIFATRNKGKVREVAAMVADLGWELESMPETAPEVVEDGETFEDNARKKAEQISALYGVPVIADDSGLEVDALNGRPGVYSARFAGEHASDSENNSKLLREIADIPLDQRTGRFVCVLAYAAPNKETVIVRGEVDGYILEQPMGVEGFGYDPLFYVPKLKRTFAELSLEEKGMVSHRAIAFRALIQMLKQGEQV